MKELTAENVTIILKDCLFNDGEDTTNHIEAKGVMLGYGFHPERIEKHRAEIEEMLNQLPPQFRKDSGGGWSFLNACMTNDNVQWGEHKNIDELICLGIAIGKVSFQLPREFWESLPGGMPYFVIN